MLTLHHLENSQSLRILWLLEELGVDYDFKMYDRDPKTMLAPPEYKAISPTGAAPVVTDDGLVLVESNAIIEYILDKYDTDNQLRPAAGTPERVRYLYWFHASQGSFQPLLTTKLMMDAMKTRAPAIFRPIFKAAVGRMERAFYIPRITALLSMIEEDLGKSTWFAGDKLTAADIVMGYSMEVAAVRAGLDKRYPNAMRFLAQMRDRPAYQRALKKDGKFKPL